VSGFGDIGFALRSLASSRVCALAPSFVSGWLAFSSVSLCESLYICGVKINIMCGAQHVISVSLALPGGLSSSCYVMHCIFELLAWTQHLLCWHKRGRHERHTESLSILLSVRMSDSSSGICSTRIAMALHMHSALGWSFPMVGEYAETTGGCDHRWTRHTRRAWALDGAARNKCKRQQPSSLPGSVAWAGNRAVAGTAQQATFLQNQCSTGLHPVMRGLCSYMMRAPAQQVDQLSEPFLRPKNARKLGQCNWGNAITASAPHNMHSMHNTSTCSGKGVPKRGPTFESRGNAAHPVAATYQYFEAGELWEAFQPNDVVARQVDAVKLILHTLWNARVRHCSNMPSRADQRYS
jgi:hypothetical protein